MDKKLKIEVYDMEGVLQAAVEGACNGKNLHETMKGVIEQGAIPVVRLADVEKEEPCGDMPMVQFRKHEPFNWANDYIAKPILMKLEMKVDQQTLACEGFGTDVLKAQERFLRAIMPEFEGE